MKLLMCVLCAVLVTGLLTGCADDDGGPTGPGPQVSSMSATIGGVSWSADILARASRSPDTPGLSLEGRGTYGSSFASVMIIIAQPSQGAFQMGGASNYDNFGRVYPPGDTAGYSTFDSRSQGTVRIASLTDNRVSGTFSFTAYNQQGASLVVAEGEFDLRVIVIDKGAEIAGEGAGHTM